MLRLLTVLGALAGAVLVYLLLPQSVDELGRRAAAIFVAAAILWATEAIPLFATSLAVVVASILLLARQGGLAGTGNISSGQFLSLFGSNIIMLFLGGLALSVSMARHGLDRAIATRVLRPFGRRPLLLLYAIMGITAFFSMWMSNTATAAMMLAIVRPLLRDAPRNDRFATGLMLGVAIAANIGGIGTPIGTPPNAIALAALRQAGYEVTFLRWMLMAVPLAVLLLAIGGLVIYGTYRPTGKGGFVATVEAHPLAAAGWATLAVLALAVGAWLTSGLHGVPDGVIALIAAAALAGLGLLGTQEVLQIDWPVLILMWGGLALGVAMQATGLVSHLDALPLRDLPVFLPAGLVVLVAIGVSQFISNTATAALLVPIVLALAAPEEGLLVVLTALACSFAMAMPVSTPPNALVFSTGRVHVRDLLRVGGLMGLAAIVVVMAGYRIMVPLALPGE